MSDRERKKEKPPFGTMGDQPPQYFQSQQAYQSHLQQAQPPLQQLQSSTTTSSSLGSNPKNSTISSSSYSSSSSSSDTRIASARTRPINSSGNNMTSTASNNSLNRGTAAPTTTNIEFLFESAFREGSKVLREKQNISINEVKVKRTKNPRQSLSIGLLETMRTCDPSFIYDMSCIPTCFLTNPSEAIKNGNWDNENDDLVLYMGMTIPDTKKGLIYLVREMLGQGTFGQVVKCEELKTKSIVAVKIIKNRELYFRESLAEIKILRALSAVDPDKYNFVKIFSSFMFQNHLCIVIELLGNNLYRHLNKNNFNGLSKSEIKLIAWQILMCLVCLKNYKIIHCDLKPENILIAGKYPQIKVIDFGSSCIQGQSSHEYIQSRYYRSPEVLLGLPYTCAIDMWSFGCVCAELFLGIPIFPGSSAYNQMCRVVETMGVPPNNMIETSKNGLKFFVKDGTGPHGEPIYRIKTIREYTNDIDTKEQPSRRYFEGTSLEEIIHSYPNRFDRDGTIDDEKRARDSFIDFLRGTLTIDPDQRWTPKEALSHPFITGKEYKGPHQPDRTSTPEPRPTIPNPPHLGTSPTSTRVSRQAYQSTDSLSQSFSTTLNLSN